MRATFCEPEAWWWEKIKMQQETGNDFAQTLDISLL